MNVIAQPPPGAPRSSLSDAARERLLSVRGEPLFLADWLRPVFIHFEAPSAELQPHVPFELDLREGRAYVSLVAFTMRGLHLCRGGRLGAWLFAPIATHELLNVRTYVRHQGEAGIYFIAEWVPNRLSAWLGPRTFGLPYIHGQLQYSHAGAQPFCGLVKCPGAALSYTATPESNSSLAPCAPGSIAEFLLERYTAFTTCGCLRAWFRVWHPPWLQMGVSVQIQDSCLLRERFPWFAYARLVGANYSPGAEDVWMGRPHRL